MARPENNTFIWYFGWGLVSGTCNSVATKVILQTISVGSDGNEEEFDKPWFLTFCMFVAMLMALAVWFCEKAPGPALWKRSVFWATGPCSLCDLFGSGLQTCGLIYVPVSVYQMLKGMIIPMSAIVSLVFLKKRIAGYQVVGLAMCTISLGLVGWAGSGVIPDNYSPHEFLSGVLLILIGQVVCATQYVVEERLLANVECSPTLLVGLEGFWGCLFMVVMLPLLQAGVLPFGAYEDTVDTFGMMKHSWTLIGMVVLVTVSMFIYNICGVSITNIASAVHHTFLDASRTILIWGVAVGLHTINPMLGESLVFPWSLVQFLGFLLLLAGEALYGGLHLQKETRSPPLSATMAVPLLSPFVKPLAASPIMAASSPALRFMQPESDFVSAVPM